MGVGNERLRELSSVGCGQFDSAHRYQITLIDHRPERIIALNAARR
jgi:hypothetical protein